MTPQPRRLEEAPSAPDMAGLDLQQLIQMLAGQGQESGVSDAANEGNSLMRSLALKRLSPAPVPPVGG